jgi:phosphohistidine phosphatase
VPALVLCSSAARTRETLELITPALGPKTVTRVLDSLYLADLDALLDHLRTVPADVQSTMVVAHNPGLQDLATSLAAGGGPEIDQLRAKFPTGAMATLRMRSSTWQQLATGCADLTGFVLPRDLEHRTDARRKR